MTSCPVGNRMEGTTSLTDFREIDEVLRSSDFVQAAYGDAVQPLVNDTLTAIDGQHHAARTRLENKLFSRDAIAYYKREAIEPELREALAGLDAQRDEQASCGRTSCR